MKFWDASALVPLLVEEGATGTLMELLRRDPEILAWWGSTVECASAIARLERDGDLSTQAANDAFARLATLTDGWHEVQPAVRVRETGVRLLRVHPLRAADALQLAAAFVASEQRPTTLEFVCLDERLRSAAAKEGFRIVDIGS